MRAENIDINDLPPLLQSVHDIWDELRGVRFAPSWGNIDLVTFPSRVLPTTMVVDVRDPIETSVFRYWGSKLTDIHEEEMTGRCPYELPPAEFGQQLLEDHREIVAKKIPIAWHYSFLVPGGYIHSHSVVRMPLSDDGEVVNHIIVVVDFSPEALAMMDRSREKFSAFASQTDDGAAG